MGTLEGPSWALSWVLSWAAPWTLAWALSWGQVLRFALSETEPFSEPYIDGPAIRNANGRVVRRIDSRKKTQTIFMTFKRFARVTSNLRFESSVPCNAIRKKRGSIQEPSGVSRKTGDARESVNGFARIGPSKLRATLGLLGNSRRRSRKYIS